MAKVIRVGLAVYFEVDPTGLGLAVVGPEISGEASIESVGDSAGDIAFVAGVVARSVFVHLGALSGLGAFSGGAVLLGSMGSVMSALVYDRPAAPGVGATSATGGV